MCFRVFNFKLHWNGNSSKFFRKYVYICFLIYIYAVNIGHKYVILKTCVSMLFT